MPDAVDQTSIATAPSVTTRTLYSYHAPDNANMPVEVALNTPLADALTAAVQPKLMEVGWAGDSNDSALAEYIILMLVNGKDQNQIAAELSGELLNLPPEDPTSHDFARWLFEQLAQLNAQINGQPETADSNGADAANGGAPSNEMDTDMGANEGPGFSAYVPPVVPLT